MGVVSTHAFRTLPGGFSRHLEASEEARRRLQSLGLQAMTMIPINGSFSGQIVTVVNSADHREWAADTARVQSDPGWMQWYAGVADEGFAEEAESSVYVDIDPTFSPDTDRPLGALMATQWRPAPGRAADLIGHIEQAKPHIERLGGAPRILQCMSGAEPMTMLVSITFEDLAHLGEYNDKLAVDEQWQSFWTGVMANPSAALVRAGTFTITA